MGSGHLSLHALLRERHPELADATVSKRAMTTVSHLVEAIAERDGDQGRVVACFQQRRHWEVERPRYEAMAPATLALAAGLGQDAQPSQLGARPVLATLPQGHALTDDWVVLVYGPRCSIVLAGADLEFAPGTGPLQPSRAFRTVLTAKPWVCADALTGLLELAGPQLPAGVTSELQAAADQLRGRSDALTDDELAVRLLARLDRGLSEDEERGRVQERRRLAEALHDESLQSLLAASQDLQEVLDGGNADPGLQAAQRNLRVGVDALRATIRAAYLAQGTTDPLPTRLEQLVAHHARRAGFVTEVSVEADACGRADELVVATVRELVTNAAKHAGASRVTVSVRLTGDEVAVEVADDGRGADAEQLLAREAAGHVGLVLAAGRVRQAGGTWTVRTAPGQGFRVAASLPRAAPAARPQLGLV